MSDKIWYEMEPETGFYVVMSGDPDGECEIAEMNGNAIRGMDLERIEILAEALADFERKEYIGEAYRYRDYSENEREEIEDY